MERWRNDRVLAENRRNNVAVSSHFLLHSIKATAMQSYSAKFFFSFFLLVSQSEASVLLLINVESCCYKMLNSTPFITGLSHLR